MPNSVPNPFPWLLAVALVAAGAAGAGQETREPRIVVDPDYLVSRDGDRPHVEIMAAANPRNPRNLLAGAITFTRPGGGAATKAYVSFDGGVQWDDITFPEQKETGGGDPQVAFTAAGTAIFATLANRADETGRTRAFLHAYRSADGGRTWSAPYDLGASYDHPMLAADQTTGPFAGRLYMSVLYGREYSLGVFRSEDDGRSWIGPVKFLDGAGERGLNVDPMLVFHDGAVMVPFVDFPSTPEQTANWTESRLWTVVSTDGGVTFSEPKPGPVKMTGEETRLASEGTPRFRGGSWTMLAADRSEPFRDRAYAVWPDYSEGLPRVVISWSDDRGSTWSDPGPVASPGGSGCPAVPARGRRQPGRRAGGKLVRHAAGSVAVRLPPVLRGFLRRRRDVHLTNPGFGSALRALGVRQSGAHPGDLQRNGRRTAGRTDLRGFALGEWWRLHGSYHVVRRALPPGLGRRAVGRLSGVHGGGTDRGRTARAAGDGRGTGGHHRADRTRERPRKL